MVSPTHTTVSDRYQPRSVHETVESAIDGLQARELVEPALLLSAGYVALPFLLRQGVLLLAPLFALCGFPLGGFDREREEATRVAPQ